MSLHDNATGTSVHKPFRQEFANAAARTGDATIYVAADLNKFAVQLDDNTLWRLSSYSPTIWTACGGGGGGLTIAAVQTASFSAVAGNLYPVSTTGSPIVITLPPPAMNDEIGFILFNPADPVTFTGGSIYDGSGPIDRLFSEYLFIKYDANVGSWYAQRSKSNYWNGNPGSDAGAGGDGLPIQAISGKGGAGSAGNGGNGATASFNSGDGGSSVGGQGGNAGHVHAYAGNGGATDPTGTTGGQGGDADLIGGIGGLGGTGNGGQGGRAYISPGYGGNSDTGVGGDGGSTQIYSGGGGSGPAGDGNAGYIQIIGGNGGTFNGGGGGGGRITIKAGDNTDPALNPFANQSTSGNLFVLSGNGAANPSGAGGAAGFSAFQGGTGGAGTGGNGGSGGLVVLGGGQGGSSDIGTGGAGALAAVSGGIGASGATPGNGGNVEIEGGGGPGTAGVVKIGTNGFLAAFGSKTSAIEMGNTTYYPPITQVGSVRQPTATLTPGANITVNLAQRTNAQVTLDQNSTLDFSNVADGIRGTIIVRQDGTGGWTLANGTNMKTPGGTALAISAGASTVSVIDYYCDGTDVFATLRGAAFA